MIKRINHLNLEQEIRLKQVMNQKWSMKIVIFDLKPQW